MRNYRREFVMTEEEALDLKEKAEKACMSESRLIRLLIKGYRPPVAPGEEFHKDMNELLKVAEGIHDVARRILDEDVKAELKSTSTELRHLRMQLQEKYLKGERINIKWQ